MGNESVILSEAKDLNRSTARGSTWVEILRAKYARRKRSSRILVGCAQNDKFQIAAMIDGELVRNAA
jgi:hypothetical protein